MNAKEARKKYFEDYIDFEFYIRKISLLLKIRSSGRKLSEVIDNITSSTSFPTFGVTAKSWKTHKSRRNWLAHQHGNSNANAILVQDFETITSINSKLVDIINLLKEK